MNKNNFSEEAIFNKVADIISELFEIERKEITCDSLLEGDLGGDGLDIMEVIMTIEQVFGISIPEEDVDLFIGPIDEDDEDDSDDDEEEEEWDDCDEEDENLDDNDEEDDASDVDASNEDIQFNPTRVSDLVSVIMRKLNGKGN